MKKTVLRIMILIMAAAVAFTAVHFAVLGDNSPTDAAFTFALENGQAILTGSTDTLSGPVVLPETIDGHTVVGIGEKAFKDCSNVTAFFFPDSITSIGAYAFENCTKLAQALLPSGLVSIGEGAFWKCTSLVSMTIPVSVTSIGSCAFYKCSALESLIVPGASTPIRSIFNVALDIGQTIAINNPAHQLIDPIVTTVYCYNRTTAYSDALQDSFCNYELLDNYMLTSYTVRCTDEADIDVADPYTLSSQPVGIRVAAVAPAVEQDELAYPSSPIRTIELSEIAANNLIVFVYETRSYTITFDENGGDYSVDPLIYQTKDETAIGTTVCYGYELLYWEVIETSDDPSYNWGEIGTTYLPTDSVYGKSGDVTLQAVWKLVFVTATFNGQGGRVSQREMSVYYGEPYGTLPTATRAGYTFEGWFTATEGGTQITAETVSTQTNDHKLYAHWLLNQYAVTVTTDGHGTASADPAVDVLYNTPVTLTAEADPGYTFLAWESDDVTITDNTFVHPDKAVTIRATFAANHYTIVFDANGGENTMDPIETQYGADVALPPCTFEKADLIFCGWALTPDAETPDFENEATVCNLTETSNGTVTLYALWISAGSVELVPAEDSAAVVDNDLWFIYGLDYGVTEDVLLNQLLTVVGNGHAEIETATGMIGTGTVVNVINDVTGNIDASYEIVIFGDLNGDGMLNAADVSIIRSVNARLIAFDLDSARFYAADVIADGMINAADVARFRSANARLIELSQVI